MTNAHSWAYREIVPMRNPVSHTRSYGFFQSIYQNFAKP
jgi:hypothetical protein